MDNESVTLRIIERLIDKFEPLLAAIEKSAALHAADFKHLEEELHNVKCSSEAHQEDIQKILEFIESVQWFYTWMKTNHQEETIQKKVEDAREQGLSEGRKDSFAKSLGSFLIRHFWKLFFGLLGSSLLLDRLFGIFSSLLPG